MKHFKTIALALLLLPLEAMAQFAWYGADGEARVKTDLGIGNDTDGEWYSIGDWFDGGKSYVTIFDSGGPMPTDEDVQAYGGIKGQIKLDYGTASYSLAGIGFFAAGVDAWQHVECDASAWGGLSIGYKSDNTLVVKLNLSDDLNSETGYTHPEYVLPPTSTETFVRIPWSDFAFPEWAHVDLSGYEAAQHLVAVEFVMNGQEGTFNFLITKIGSHDMPETPSVTTGCSSVDATVNEDAGWYTLSGVQLRNEPAERGIYIHNGQKVVVK